MNTAMKAALTNSSPNYCIYVRAALFHSTPVLDRKRRSYSGPRFNNYGRRSRRFCGKQTLTRNVNAYADFLFQSWQNEYDDEEPSSSRGTSWFKKQYSAKGSKKKAGNQGAWKYGRNDFRFCEEDEDVETIFRSMFGGNKFYYWSFINEENSQWRSSSNYSNYGWSWNWRHNNKEEYQYESEPENMESDERSALGLRASGPLTIDDVKNAYRICALQWHPDRHQGSSKAAAEEKFKLCSAAYQSLYCKLAAEG
ncbi:hypothetical protein ACFX2I_008859 [Malus domestica]